MRIFRTMVIWFVIVIFVVVATKKVSANDSQTNIQIDTVLENTVFADTTTFAFIESIRNQSVDYQTIEIVQENDTEQTVSDSKREAAYIRWKNKQAHLWKNLSEKPFTINASAYTAAADECGKSDGITASGLKVKEDHTLACPPQYPFGAKIAIEGMGTYTCEDRGGAIKGNHFDIYMKTKRDAFAFGRRSLTAQIVQ